ncbi:hypothetical protein LCGC14_2139780 [marine sediment metagenome]|uniref:Uncharacterized protein n=1 Tax=marine sediment metagenome TaxID=412755 RepID=A0A0F9GV26_9ZZZZ
MNQFKVGDRVRVSENNTANTGHNGKIGIIMIIDKTNIPFHVKFDETGDNSWASKVELLGKSGKAPKAVPVDKHIVMEDSCNNYQGVFDSYNRAIEKAKNISGDTTIYKMTEIAKVSTIKQVKKKRK